MVQPVAVKRNALHELGYKIFLDRYAQKDMTRSTLAVGDTVIVVVDSATGQREIGKITAMELPQVTIELLDGDIVTRDVEHVDKPIETDPAQMMDRVARGVAACEVTDTLKDQWADNFRWLLDDWKFVPAGRILTAAGTSQALTYYNCMPPDQEILTADGYKPLADVAVGELVVTHRNRLRPVRHKFERETREALYIIRPKKLGYDDLRVTGDHKVLIIRAEWVNKHRSRDGLRLAEVPAWIPAKELKPGDYVAAAYNSEDCPPEPIYLQDYLPDYQVENGRLFKPTRRAAHGYVEDWGTHYGLNAVIPLDGDLCYLFGRWLGDGCSVHRSGTDIPAGIKIVFGLDEHEEAEAVARIIEAKFGLKPSLKLSSTGRWYDLWANSMPLGQFFKAFLGVYSQSKRIPDALMHLPRPLALELLRGLFSADGYVSGRYLGILLSNRVLATQVHQLLLRLGYLFSIKENTHRLGRTPAYRLSSTGSDCEALFGYFFGKPIPERGYDLKSYIDYDGLKWVRIHKIDVETYSGVVMDIEVEEDHSFVSAGVVVSNCYVVPSPHDSREGIIQTLLQMTEIMSRGGGVGINVSSLRPRHAYVKGVNGRSSGSVSWGALYSFVTGLIEQGGCFGPNERILTDAGLIPARELVERIEDGETIYACTHRGWRKITAHFRNGVKPLYEVRTKRGYSVRITEEHKVAVFLDGKITTMPLKYLEAGDEILLLLGHGVRTGYVDLKPLNYERSPLSTTLNENVTLPEVLTEDLAYALGYMNGDGYVHIGKKVTWQAPKAIKLATADAYPAIRQKLVNTIRDLFGVEPVVENGDGAVKNVSLYSRLVIEWLSSNGLLKAKAENIRVPEVIFHSPSSVMGAFIAGYFDADGCNRGRKGGYGIDSISRSMLADVQQLLAINGIVSTIRATDRSEHGWQTIYRLSVTGGTFKQRFANFVPGVKVSNGTNGTRDMYQTYPAEVWTALGARAKYRQRIYDGVSDRISVGQLSRIGERLAADAQLSTVEVIQDTLNTLPDQIVSIDLLGPSEVFDFEVDDVHLLSGNGIYTSNSRRGALMLILNDWHPDVFDFINSKRTAGQITNANISVNVSDKLMDAIKQDGDWELIFPDTSDPAYDTEWDGNLAAWQERGGKVIPYRTVKAREIWNAIIESAWTSAEPGIWFGERSNKMSNSYYFNPLICTNPCGEQSLGSWSVCNLGALNLAKFYDAERHDVAWADLDRATRYATRFLDNVIDTTPYFFDENKDRQLSERRVGLNNMGLAELMIRLGIRYGSPESVAFIDRLYSFMTRAAYETSVDLAQEKGAFPECDPEKLVQSGFIQSLPVDLRENVRRNGLRNVTLLTQAPTGTTGTMVNTSTGIEPFFSWVYYRKSRLGLHEEQVPIVKEWQAEHPGAELPDYFVTAMDLAPDEHVRVQAAIQRWVDSSISKTANLPNDYTVEQTRELYELMYELGCKGGTVYRDGSRSEQVLMLKEEDKPEAKAEAPAEVINVATPHRVYPRPGKLTGVTVTTRTPFGTAYITMNSDANGYPFEVFITAPGKAGSDLQADAEGLGRLISLQLRSVEPTNRRQMLRLIVDQLQGIGGARSIGMGPKRVISLPDAVAGALLDQYFTEDSPQQLDLPIAPLSPSSSGAKAATGSNHHNHDHGGGDDDHTFGVISGADICPSCATISLIRIEGCRKCLTCGYSEC